MKREFCQALVDLRREDQLLFLTGDLGFDALEPLREVLGPRFINAGIAEQNMVGVAAGLARGGFRPWVYSIATFSYARPFEQIRNDVCAHQLPVRIAGNGGGYGYGVQGSTHHALEDYGVLLTLGGLQVFVPTFGADLAPAVEQMHRLPGPAYLRLGLSEEPRGFRVPPFAPWRRLVEGAGPTVVAVGAIAGSLVEPLSSLEGLDRPSLWSLSVLPFTELPEALLADLARSKALVVVEEHVAQGGVAQMLAHHLLLRGLAPRTFRSHAAAGYVTGLHGSQKYHRRECGLDPASVRDSVLELARGLAALRAS
ncbi:MAG: transketolase [Deltaproteobacteria bacterium]|nr:transketolase [Deltaproteobacteria bacterium]